MTDPFEALRAPAQPVDPDPRFAAELRERLRRAVLNGGEMTGTEAPARAELHSLTPYLAVSDARRALDFYVEVFGAQRRGDPIVMPDGKVGHAELAIGDSVLMLAEEFEDIGHVTSDGGGASIRIELSDVDAVVQRAAERGAQVLSPVEDSGHGRSGSIRDPFGQRWLISQAPVRAGGQDTARHGQAVYFTFQVPDDELAKTFYGTALGWQFSPGTVEGAWRFEGPGLEGGLWGGPRQVGWKPMYAVDDVHAAVERVRSAGGRITEVKREPYGLTADCVDNQGIEFWLWQP